MIEKLKQSTKEKIKKMGLGELVQEMHHQLIMFNSELKRVDNTSSLNQQLYLETTKRKEDIRKRYEPIVEALTDEMNLYHK